MTYTIGGVTGTVGQALQAEIPLQVRQVPMFFPFSKKLKAGKK